MILINFRMNNIDINMNIDMNINNDININNSHFGSWFGARRQCHW